MSLLDETTAAAIEASKNPDVSRGVQLGLRIAALSLCTIAEGDGCVSNESLRAVADGFEKTREKLASAGGSR